MKCPISGLECQQVEVRLTDGPVMAYRCVQYGSTVFVLLSPDAWERLAEERARALAIIAAAKGDDEYGRGG